MPQKYSNVTPSIEIKQYRKRFQLLCGISIILGLIILFLLILAVLFFAGVFTGLSGYQIGRDVELKCAKLNGKENDGIVEYLGIPYAMPPVNEYRFLHAKEIIKEDECKAAFKTRDEVYQAHNYKSSCIQYDHDNNLKGSEDCLYLNVFVPPMKSATEKLPVVFVIHGVFFSFGRADMPGFKVTPELVKTTRAIHVTCNYRLGPMNTFVNPTNNQTNHGLSDLLSALTWVHKNIARFHGNPANVLLLGSGTGSTLALALHTSPMSANLFAKVWLSSPAFKLSTDAQTVKKAQAPLIMSQTKLPNIQKIVRVKDMFKGYDWSNLAVKFQYNWFNMPQTKMNYFANHGLYFLVKDDYYIKTNNLLDSIPTNRVIPMIVGNNFNDVDILPHPNTIKIWNRDHFKNYMTNKINISLSSSIVSKQKMYENLESHYARDKNIDYEDAYTAALSDLRVTCPLDSKLKTLLKKSGNHLIYRYVVKDTHRSFDAFSLQHRTKYSAYMWDSIVYFGGYKHLDDYGQWDKNDLKMTKLFRDMLYQIAYNDRIKELQISNNGYVRMNLIRNGVIERDCFLNMDECKFWNTLYGGVSNTGWVV